MLLCLHQRTHGHSIGHTRSLWHELLYCACELIVSFNAHKAPVDYFLVIFLPIGWAFPCKSGPVPSTYTLTLQALKENKLSTFWVSHKHAYMVPFWSHQASQDLGLHLSSWKQNYIPCLRDILKFLVRYLTHFPEFAWSKFSNLVISRLLVAKKFYDWICHV